MGTASRTTTVVSGIQRDYGNIRLGIAIIATLSVPFHRAKPGGLRATIVANFSVADFVLTVGIAKNVVSESTSTHCADSREKKDM